MRSVANKDTFFGGFVLLLGLAVAWGASQITVGFSFDPVGPRLFPLLIAAGMVLTGGAILVTGLSAGAVADPADDLAEPYEWTPVGTHLARPANLDFLHRHTWLDSGRHSRLRVGLLGL